MSKDFARIPYDLYKYRKELQRRDLDTIHLLKAKMYLTNDLVMKTVKNIHKCLDNGVSGKTFEKELKVLTREVKYKKKLQRRIEIQLRKKEHQTYKEAEKQYKTKKSTGKK